MTIEGKFDRGDLVAIKDQSGKVIGHGLSSYGSRDALKIRGHKSREIGSMLGYRGRDEVIHTDNLVMTED